MEVKRGEIWWASLPDPRGAEPGYRRPLLVVQADAFNRSAIKTVLCAVVTSNLSLEAAPGNIRLSARSSGLPKASVANVSQLVTVDKRFMTKRVKALDAHIMAQADEGLRLVMNL